MEWIDDSFGIRTIPTDKGHAFRIVLRVTPLGHTIDLEGLYEKRQSALDEINRILDSWELPPNQVPTLHQAPRK